MLCGHGTTIGVLLMLCGGGAALAQPAPARDALANARALAAAGQSGPARALLEPLTTDEESAGHAHLLLGALDEQEGRLAEAIAHYDLARGSPQPPPAIAARNGYWHGEAGMRLPAPAA